MSALRAVTVGSAPRKDRQLPHMTERARARARLTHSQFLTASDGVMALGKASLTELRFGDGPLAFQRAMLI
jgi:hypothetical protein